MIQGLPQHINVIFIITCILTFGFIYYVLLAKEQGVRSLTPLASLVSLTAWILLLTILSVNGFFLDFESTPPRFIIIIGPPLLAIGYLLINKNSRAYIRQLPIVGLTYLHVIRIPVEIVLYWLFLAGYVPELMTYEGRNLDILSGISAPFVAYYALSKLVKIKMGAMIWNFVALGLLLNVVINAIFSTPYPFQLQAFEQPNLAVFYFPFVLLPGFIVPIVLFSHLASILILSTKDTPFRQA